MDTLICEVTLKPRSQLAHPLLMCFPTGWKLFLNVRLTLASLSCSLLDLGKFTLQLKQHHPTNHYIFQTHPKAFFFFLIKS